MIKKKCSECGTLHPVDHVTECTGCGEPEESLRTVCEKHPNLNMGGASSCQICEAERGIGEFKRKEKQWEKHAPINLPSHCPNYLVQSILVTIFCCWPFGIPAIIFAAKVDGMVSRGDIAGALEASKKAKTWTWVSFGCGLTVIGLYLLVVMIADGMLGL